MLVWPGSRRGLLRAAYANTDDPAGNPARANPYQAIVERNVFGLKPAAARPIPSQQAAAAKILLQGITTFGGVKRCCSRWRCRPNRRSKPKGSSRTFWPKPAGWEIEVWPSTRMRAP